MNQLSLVGLSLLITHLIENHLNKSDKLYFPLKTTVGLVLGSYDAKFKRKLASESLFLYHTAFLKERNAITKNLIVVIFVLFCVHPIINLL